MSRIARLSAILTAFVAFSASAATEKTEIVMGFNPAENAEVIENNSKAFAEYYQKGDPVAVQLVDDGARALGAAVGGVVNLLSPDVVVIGGGVAGALGDPYIERVWELAQRHTLPGAAENVRCVAAALGDDSGVIGCAAYARSRRV